MFSNQSNPAIVQVRRELRGQMPDSWINEVISIAEFQLSYQTIDELYTEDILKLRIAAEFSPMLKRQLDQTLGQQQRPQEQHQAIVRVEPQQRLFGKAIDSWLRR